MGGAGGARKLAIHIGLLKKDTVDCAPKESMRTKILTCPAANYDKSSFTFNRGPTI